MTQLIQALRDKEEQAKLLIDRSPLGEDNLNEYREIWCAAAVNAMTELATEANLADKKGASIAIINALMELSNTEDVRQAFANSITRFSHGTAKNFVAPFITDLINRRLAFEHVQGFRFSTADLVKKIEAGFQKTLNERPWAVIEKSFLSSAAGRPIELKSTIVPAEQLGRSNEAPRGPIAGFKTGSISSITERLGGSEYREFHRGGSGHVNV